MNADGSSSGNPPTALLTDGNGIAQASVSTGQAGLNAYVPSLSSVEIPAQAVNTQVNTYQYVRVHPADADVAALPPTFENVYRRVLANWNAMAPCMDNWLDLADPIQIKAYASIFKRAPRPRRVRHKREGFRIRIGCIFSSSAGFPYRIPTPVGPNNLCPEKA